MALSGHAVFNLAVIDPHTQFYNRHASLKGIWVRFSAEEASRVDTAQLDSASPFLGTTHKLLVPSLSTTVESGAMISTRSPFTWRASQGTASSTVVKGRQDQVHRLAPRWCPRPKHGSQHREVPRCGWDVDTVLNRAVERAWDVLKQHPVAHREIAEILERTGYLITKTRRQSSMQRRRDEQRNKTASGRTPPQHGSP